MRKHEEMPLVEGYIAEKRTISLLKANLFSLVIMAVLLIVCIFLMHLICHSKNMEFQPGKMFILLVCLVAGIVVHELIHGITWMLVTRKGFSHISFGIIQMSPYCHIDVPMPKRKYVIGALMPLLVLGVLPTIVAFIIGSYLWLLFGIIFITAAAGDIMIVWAIRKEPADALVYDHPSEGGCYVYHKVQ